VEERTFRVLGEDMVSDADCVSLQVMVTPSSSLSWGRGVKAMSLIVSVGRGTVEANNDDCSALSADDEGLRGWKW
jgi:hypothetical protein